jgi:hypothetical protein
MKSCSEIFNSFRSFCIATECSGISGKIRTNQRSATGTALMNENFTRHLGYAEVSNSYKGKIVGGKTKHTNSKIDLQTTTLEQVTGKSSASTARSKKANALRAKKRAVARKVRKNKLLTLLVWHDKAVKDGNEKTASKLFAAFKADQLVRSDIDKMRAVVGELSKAFQAVDKQAKKIPAPDIESEKNKITASPDKLTKDRRSIEKKLGEAQQRLKKAQTAEQGFFAALIKKQTKNGVCPFCQIKRVSVDSHVMDMHPPHWGEYLTLLGKLK